MFQKWFVSYIPISPAFHSKCNCTLGLAIWVFEQVAKEAKCSIFLDTIFKPIIVVQPYRTAWAISISNFPFWKFMVNWLEWLFQNICSSNCILIINIITCNWKTFTWIMWKAIDIIDRQRRRSWWLWLRLRWQDIININCFLKHTRLLLIFLFKSLL